MKNKDKATTVCPVCSETMDSGATTCPHCGATSKSAWEVKMENENERKLARIASLLTAGSVLLALGIYFEALGEFTPTRFLSLSTLGFLGGFVWAYFFSDFFKLRKARVWLPAKGGVQ